MPAERRVVLLRRIASLERTPPDVIHSVLDVMRKKVKDHGFAALRDEPKSWISAAADILNNMGGAERDLLDELEDRDSEAFQLNIEN